MLVYWRVSYLFLTFFSRPENVLEHFASPRPPCGGVGMISSQLVPFFRQIISCPKETATAVFFL